VGAHRPRRGAQEGGGGDRLIVRVQPDVPAIHRAFDYSLPSQLLARFAGAGRVGTVVRVPLHGRRVRGWVLDADVAEPEATELRDVLAVVGAGPPPEVVDLCRWAAWRWAGPLASFLRAASAPNVVAAGAVEVAVEVEQAVYPGAPLHGEQLELIGPRVAIHVPIAPEGSTLVIDPSAARAAQLASQLEGQGREVVTLGSEHADAVRTAHWDRARAGACVVLGGRAAVWAPVPDLRAVVVVDEGDEALEDERAPTWNARDVAVERARCAGAAVRVLTPAPTVDALVAIGEPVGGAGGWPPVEVVDQRDEEPGHGVLSAALADALRDAVGRGARAVCVLNRRGRARLLACRTCRELARCERCGATVEQREDGFVCAHCGTARPSVCLHCHGSTFRAVRPGITRVRDDLAALLPRVEVASVDASNDAVPDVPVLVGTEAVLHRLVGRGGVGASRPAGRPTGLVAYLELDQELLAPRARAAEQALWLLVRGARLLDDRGRLLLQTRLPDHEVVRAARRGDPMIVAGSERTSRAALGFPPFGGLAEVSGAPEAVAAACAAVATAGATVLGPVADGSRALVRAPSVAALCDALATPAVEAARTRGRLRIDVDPRRV
jgi:primosomal protein N' (replication factor Y) (superfamily II helicase)